MVDAYEEAQLQSKKKTLCVVYLTEELALAAPVPCPCSAGTHPPARWRAPPVQELQQLARASSRAAHTASTSSVGFGEKKLTDQKILET
jgi:hypothetical protein